MNGADPIPPADAASHVDAPPGADDSAVGPPSAPPPPSAEGESTAARDGTEGSTSAQATTSPATGNGEPAPSSGSMPVPAPPTSPTIDEPLVESFAAGDLPVGGPGVDEVAVPEVADLPPDELRAVIESLLFVATRPLSLERIQGCLPGASQEYLAGFLTGLAERYDRENRGWELRQLAHGWQLLTRRALHPWVRQLERKELPTKLSKGALETLAIVAYRQPVTRGVIEDIRGVQCGPVLRQLMDLKLVLVSGRDDAALGRPLLYGTTETFLLRFGLRSAADLPRRHEFGA